MDKRMSQNYSGYSEYIKSSNSIIPRIFFIMVKKRLNAKFIGNAILNSPVEYALQILGDKSTLLILNQFGLEKENLKISF